MIGHIKNRTLRRLALIVAMPLITIAYIVVTVLLILIFAVLDAWTGVRQSLRDYQEIVAEFKESWK